MIEGPGLRFVVLVDDELVDDEVVPTMADFRGSVGERQAALCREAQEAGKPWRVEVRDPVDGSVFAVLPSGLGLLR